MTTSTPTATATATAMATQAATPDAAEREAERSLRDAEDAVARLEAKERALAPRREVLAKKGDIRGLKAIAVEQAELAEQLAEARITAGRLDVALQKIRYQRVAGMPRTAAAAIEPARAAARQAEAAYRDASLAFRQAQNGVQLAENLVAGATRELGWAQSRLDKAIKEAAALVKEGGAA